MECDLPPDALLRRYADGVAYTDCWTLLLPRDVAHADYIEAFYITPLFRLERLVLALVGRASTDAQARALSRGESDRFAAWTVEARAPRQLLLCDFLGRTRSWLMSAALDDGTRLYFGSAVVPKAGAADIGRNYLSLLGAHRLYSRLLLRACARRLAR